MNEQHLDGNALGSLFEDLFGREMTNQLGCCDECGTISALGSVIVYRSAGDVIRCPGCGNIVMVVVVTPSGARVSFESLRWIAIT